MGKNIGSWLKRNYSQERDALLSIILALFIVLWKSYNETNRFRYFRCSFSRKYLNIIYYKEIMILMEICTHTKHLLDYIWNKSLWIGEIKVLVLFLNSDCNFFFFFIIGWQSILNDLKFRSISYWRLYH